MPAAPCRDRSRRAFSSTVSSSPADPANPQRPAREVGYPAAGTDNALVTLVRLELDGAVTPVRWDTSAFEYLASVHWSAHGPALLAVLSRDQRTGRVDKGSVPRSGLAYLYETWHMVRRSGHWAISSFTMSGLPSAAARACQPSARTVQ